MEKPETKLEKQACEEARNEVVEKEVAKLKEVYRTRMEKWIEKERSARLFREQADELREKLEVTDDEMEQIFEE